MSNVGVQSISSVKVLKLALTAGAFSVLPNTAGSQTCYTDATGTGRTAYATPEALLAFASAVLSGLGLRQLWLEARLAPQWTATTAIPCSDASVTAASMSSTTPTSAPSAPWIA